MNQQHCNNNDQHSYHSQDSWEFASDQEFDPVSNRKRALAERIKDQYNFTDAEIETGLKDFLEFCP